MNPIKVFLSIFAAGLFLAVILGIIGVNQPTDIAGEDPDATNAEETPGALADMPSALGGCLDCHGGELEGGAGPSLLDLDLSEADIIAVLKEGPGIMPSYEDTMSEEELEEIAAYLVELSTE